MNQSTFSVPFPRQSTTTRKQKSPTTKSTMTSMLLSSRSLARRLRPSIAISTNPFSYNGARFIVVNDVTSLRFLSSSTSSSTDIASGRSQFKNVPVNPSILSYIQYVGVGIPKKSKKRPRRRESGEVLSEKDEEDHFRQQSPHQKPLTARRPPPPFVAPSSSNDTTEAGQIIQRFPVKLIGSSGSVDDEFPFPRPFKGLPEVVRRILSTRTILWRMCQGRQSFVPFSLIYVVAFIFIGNCRAIQCWKVDITKCSIIWQPS
jgi:hypothetical protein